MNRATRSMTVALAAALVAALLALPASAVTPRAPLQRVLTIAKAGTGSGTVTSDVGGIDCGTTCSASYNTNTSITLTATPGANSVFVGWSGGGCSGTGTCTFSIKQDTTVTATFDVFRTLTVGKSGTGSGTVTSNPAGIDCGSTCSATFGQGTTVTLTATPDVNSTFAGWSGACTGTGSCVVTMTANRSVTATFTIKSYSLNVSRTGTGSGTVTSSPAGIDCGATCSANFTHGTTVTLTATPDVNSTFTGWSGSGCSGTGTCVVTMTAAASVVADFSAITHQLSVTRSGTGTGTVTSSPAGIDCGTTCAADFKQGSSVTLAASADPHSTFTGWSGSGCSGTGTCIVTVSAAASVDANFTLKSYPLSVSLSGSGDGTVTSDIGAIDCGATCSDTYDALSVVTLTATPDANSIFAGWSGDCSGMSTCQLDMDGAKAATATFILKSFQVSVSLGGSGAGTVTSDIGAIDCGATCSDTYDALSVVTLTATPDANSTFTGWSGSCGGSGACVMTIDGNKNVTATFEPIIHDVLVVTTGAGGGTVTSNPAGIACGATCTAGFGQGSSVILSAVPDPDSAFTGWSGDCGGTGDCVLDIDGPHQVSANFEGPRRPDGLVGLSVRSLKGDGIYNLTGAGQTQSGAVRAGRKRTYLIAIKNQGVQADRFLLEGDGNKAPFKVTYLVEGMNITAPMVAGTYRSPSLWSGERLLIQMVVRARKGAKAGKVKSWLTTVTSLGDPGKVDAVKVNAKVKARR